MKNCRARGARGERAWRDELRAAGYTSARRGQQFAGGADSPDVVCEELNGWHFEVKFCERANAFEFMAQAIADAGAKIPTVAMRKNHHPFLVVIRASDFFAMLRNCDLPALASRERRTT